MTASIRSRFVFWLLFLCVLCFMVQLFFFGLFELHEIRNDPSIELEEEQEEALVLIGAQLISLPFLALMVWVISGRMLRPLKSIAQTAEQIRTGKFDERIPVETPDDEIGIVARSINVAFDRYHDAVDRLDRFSADASHQMRTPLTAIRAMGEVALRRERSGPEYKESIAEMLDEVHRLTRIVDQLLMLARLETGEVRKAFEVVDLRSIAGTVADRFAPAASDKGAVLRVVAEEFVQVLGDAGLLEQALSNLVDNAIRYSPASGAIEIRIRNNKGLGITEVLDAGPGVPTAFKPKLFERFTRAQGSQGEGAGLGLAIVADIARVHRGTVEVADNAPAGALFRIAIPAVES